MSVAVLSSCGKNDRWFQADELFKNEKWLSCKEPLVSRHTNNDEFFLKIIRKNDSIDGIYIDNFNKVNARFHESPTSLTASMNIKQDSGTKIFSQLIIRINRQDLSYSKKTTMIQKDFYGDWGSIGGIHVPNAGTCLVMENPPKQII